MSERAACARRQLHRVAVSVLKRRAAAPVIENHENERFPNSVLNKYLNSFGVKPVSEMMKMNEFRTRFLSGYLYSFGVKQVSEICVIASEKV